MECMAPPRPEAIALDALIAAVAPRGGPPPAPADLLAAFAAVPDPRHARGRRFALPALLALAVAAILANHLSVLAIAQWGARQRRPPTRKCTPRSSPGHAPGVSSSAPRSKER